ncbi:hypothetical protein CEXT_157501 [Caerostris extrusa]|uniref:Uncharacterized protein n=1 Tax=Caerostris extrusa TaxID=172846 RepID=A0AAV4VSV3_CAEEX|nr:hypothetical protein CEXT_157501 [Caerostris extrusa]
MAFGKERRRKSQTLVPRTGIMYYYKTWEKVLGSAEGFRHVRLVLTSSETLTSKDKRSPKNRRNSKEREKRNLLSCQTVKLPQVMRLLL